MKRIMIAGTNSGSGKTTLTIGLISALMKRGYEVSSFKCGPDYIDPMFHGKILGASGRNLDSIFCDEATICHLLRDYSKDFSVIEGVMGFYDGVLGKGSSAEVSRITDTPVILVLDCKGMSESMGAVISGFVNYKENNIKGVVFNRLPEGLTGMAMDICREMGLKYLGRLPFNREYSLESRHLGLVTADEVAGLKEKVDLLSKAVEENLMLDDIVNLADVANIEIAVAYDKVVDNKPRIAIAKDEAFCFIYNDNVSYLEKAGCEVCYFSPLRDKKVPDEIDGIIIPGGYPELYLSELSSNIDMLKSVRECVNKVPIIAECGGFMYLHDCIKTDDEYKMAGVINGTVTKKERLVRFGYVNMKSDKDSLFGDSNICVNAHEFHYFDSDNNGRDMDITKLSNQTNYKSVHLNENMYAGFPHIYFYGNREAADNFIKKCSEYKKKREAE